MTGSGGVDRVLGNKERNILHNENRRGFSRSKLVLPFQEKSRLVSNDLQYQQKIQRNTLIDILTKPEPDEKLTENCNTKMQKGRNPKIYKVRRL